jgi:glycerate kinase
VTPSSVLVASEAFDRELNAARVARAIGRGLLAKNPELEAEECPLDAPPRDLDARIWRARAVVIAAARLNHETLLRRDAVAEIATRARQRGVPCYAIAGSEELDPFEARILDLQVVLQASGERELSAAGRKLAGLV